MALLNRNTSNMKKFGIYLMRIIFIADWRVYCQRSYQKMVEFYLVLY